MNRVALAIQQGELDIIVGQLVEQLGGQEEARNAVDDNCEVSTVSIPKGLMVPIC